MNADDWNHAQTDNGRVKSHKVQMTGAFYTSGHSKKKQKKTRQERVINVGTDVSLFPLSSSLLSPNTSLPM